MEQRVVEAARAVGCSQFHLEAMRFFFPFSSIRRLISANLLSESLQAEGSKRELDNQLYHCICGIAKVANANGVTVATSLGEVRDKLPAVYQKLVETARTFKLAKVTVLKHLPENKECT